MTTPMTWPGCGAKFVRDNSAEDKTMTEQEQIRVLREALEDLLNSQSSYQIAQHRDPTGSSRRCHAAAELVAAMDKAGQALDDTDPASIQPVAAQGLVTLESAII